MLLQINQTVLGCKVEKGPAQSIRGIQVHFHLSYEELKAFPAVGSMVRESGHSEAEVSGGIPIKARVVPRFVLVLD